MAKRSRASRKLVLKIMLFWMIIGGAVVCRIAYFDQIVAQAASRPL
jgi:hypothetical protein